MKLSVVISPGTARASDNPKDELKGTKAMKPSPFHFLYALCCIVCFGAFTLAHGANLYVSLDGGNEIGRLSDGGAFGTIVSGLHYPSGLAFDSSNNLYVADYSAGAIRRISASGALTTFASLLIPYGLAFDNSGNLFVSHLGTTSNTNFDTVSRITSDGTVSTFATGFTAPSGMAFDSTGHLYVANRDAGTISKVTPSGTVSTFATGLSFPVGLAFDAIGRLYVANWGDSTIRRITADGTVNIFANSGLYHPIGIAFDDDGNLFVANYDGNSISKVTTTGSVSTFASGLSSPAFIAFEPLPRLLISIQSSQVELCWLSRTNQIYQVQHCSTLTTNTWTDLDAPTPGTGTTTCKHDIVVPGTQQRFYRVVLAP